MKSIQMNMHCKVSYNGTQMKMEPTEYFLLQDVKRFAEFKMLTNWLFVMDLVVPQK